ncbi:MAG: glycosyltransferase [bacterium]
MRRIIDNSFKAIFIKEEARREHSVALSIIIPVHDEAETIKGLRDEINDIMEEQSLSWECIWVDDGSSDQSLSVIQELCDEDTHHRYLAFEHNAGLSAALWAGFRASMGTLLVIFDSDSQSDPSHILHVVRILNDQSVDMVSGYYCTPKDTMVKKLASKISPQLSNWIAGRAIRAGGCSIRVFKKECIRSLPLFAGMHKFLSYLVAMQGYRVMEVPVAHRICSQWKTKFRYRANRRGWFGIIDVLGIFWLKKRSFHYKIIRKS